VFAAQNGGNAVSYQSTNFTAVAQAESADRALLAVASRNANAVTMNPGVMSMTASDTWVAATLSIPPQVLVAAVLAGRASLGADLTSNPISSEILRASGSIVAALVSNPLAAVIVGTGTVLAPLDTSIVLVAALQGTGTLTSQLSTDIVLAAVLTGSAAVTALLTTDIPIAATIVGEGTVSGELFISQDVSSLIATQLSIPFARLRIEGPPGVSNETLRIAVIDQEQLQTVT
jgi:hypothetical protein